MKLFGFTFSFFGKQDITEHLAEIEEVAKRDARLAAGTYIGTFKSEVSRLLQEGSQQMLEHEASENGDEIIAHAVVINGEPVEIPEAPKEQKFDYSDLSWTELRAEAREQEVKFTNKTTRVELTTMLK